MEAMGWVQESLAFFEAEYLVRLCWNTKSLSDTLCIAGSSMTSL